MDGASDEAWEFKIENVLYDSRNSKRLWRGWMNLTHIWNPRSVG
jgi:hypothetical protein